MNRGRSYVGASMAALLGTLLVPREVPAARPALVVLIVIDQFPAAVLERLEDRLAPAGFRLLMERGAWFTDARYPQAATLTGVGHATATRLHRIARLDKETHETAMFAYDHVEDPGAHGTVRGEVRIGDIAVVDDSGRELLVHEHAGRLYAHVYRIAITEATTVLAEKEGIGYEAGSVRYKPRDSLHER